MEGLILRTTKLLGLAGAALALSFMAGCSKQPDPAQRAMNAAQQADASATRAEAASTAAQSAGQQAAASATKVEQAAADAKAAADRAEAIAAKTSMGGHHRGHRHAMMHHRRHRMSKNRKLRRLRPRLVLNHEETLNVAKGARVRHGRPFAIWSTTCLTTQQSRLKLSFEEAPIPKLFA